MKKIFLAVAIFIFNYISIFADSWPSIQCTWLPWCGSGWTNALDFLWHLVAELIKYVAVIAVGALILAWFMYIFSSGDEWKTKNARNWIIWSLVAVFISISGYFLINLINEANINI